MQTGAAASIAEHPIGLLTRLRFRVTVNTDNRLMSQTSMSKEMTALVDAFGYTLEDLRWFTINAMKSAFLPFDERLAIIETSSSPGTPNWVPCDTCASAALRRVSDAPPCLASQTGAMSFLYERPSSAVITARTGAGMVALMLSVPSGEMPSVSHAKKTPPSLGGTLENFLPISLTAGSSFLDW